MTTEAKEKQEQDKRPLDKYYKPIRHINWINMTPQQSLHMDDSMCNLLMCDKVLVIPLGSVFCIAIFIITSKKRSSTLKEYKKAFAATEKQLRDQKYKWKQVPPKDGESTTKRVLVEGVRKKYYWCVHHKAWTLHSPQECRKSEENRRKRKSPSKHEGSSKRKKTYDKARIAFEALALLAQSNPTSPSSSSNYTEDSNQDSNFSGTTKDSSSSRSSTQSYKTAEYDTDES
jgi:hypothetical protein